MTQTAKAATISWWQLTVQVPQRWAEDAGAALIEAGALGVQTVGGGAEPAPMYARLAVTAPSMGQPAPGRALLVASYRPEADVTVVRLEAQEALASLQIKVDAAQIQLSRRDDSGWAERWKQYFKPLKIGRRIWVVPSWEKDFAAPSNTVVLRLDPGMAFGTGQHATTALCLRAIERYAEKLTPANRADINLLDLGCGSGILAIGAAKLGYHRVVALDNDPVAVAAARDNVMHNNVAAQVHCAETPIETISDRFSVVVANILAQPLIDMAPAIAARVKSGGLLILSGLLNSQADAVQKAYEKTNYLLLEQRWTHGEWSALALRCVGKSLF